MTVIWLSPALPVDRAHVAALLSDQHTVAPPTDLPPRESLAVATSDERQLLQALAARPADISLLLVAPAGREVPREVTEQVRPEAVGTITGDQAAADLIAATAGRRRGATAWPDYRGSTTPAAAAGALGTGAGGDGQGLRGRPRIQLLASALVAIAIIVAAILVVTNNNSSSAAATSGSGTAATGQGALGGTTGEGGGTAAGGGATGTGRSALTTAQLTKLVACLKEKGVTVSSGTTTLPRLDMSNATVRAAMQSCGTALGLGGAGAAGPAGAGSASGAPGTGGTGAAPSGRPSAPVGG